MSSLQLTLFGSPQVELDGERIVFKTRKALALLTYLVVSKQPHSRETLSTLFWPEFSSERAFANLRDALRSLKQYLTDYWLDIRRHEVMLKDTPDLQTDVLEFQAQLKQINSHEHSPAIVCAECLPLLLVAIDLYRDDFLRGFTLPDCPAFDEWHAFQTDLYREQLIDCFRKVILYAVSQGELTHAIDSARRWVALCPWSEAAHRELMRTYALNHQRTAALQQYQACQRILREEFEAEPEHETQELYETILHERDPGINARSKRSSRLKPAHEDASSLEDVSASLSFEPGGLAPVGRDESIVNIPSESTLPPNNLPAQTTTFIGREAEVSAVLHLISNPNVRLVTLIGPGGSGKTRLGLQVAEHLLEHFADGVFFISLAPINNPDLVVSTIATTLGLQVAGDASPLDVLTTYLQKKHLLLVLDNFEQILDAAPRLIALLAAAPKLTILVTSRIVLRVSGEHEYLVPPMSVPDPTKLPSLEWLTHSEAVQLFVERAKAINMDFTLTDDNAEAVAEICTRLDGLPLAIELAAARIRLFSPYKMLTRLESPLHFLTWGVRNLPARQQTLRNTIAWSYELLNEEEQTVFRRLAVFVEGWTIEAAEAVCTIADDVEVLDRVQALVDHNLLIHTDINGESRFSMLETIREYALERLTESGETEVMRQQHAQFFLMLAEDIEPKLYSPEQGIWSSRLEREYHNLRGALTWSINYDIDIGLRLTGALGRFWDVRAKISEGRDWLAQALTKSQYSRSEIDKFRAKALNEASFLAWLQYDIATAFSLGEESVTLWRNLDDTRSLAHALCVLGEVVYAQGKPDKALSLLEESIALFQHIDDYNGLASAFRWHAHVTYMQRDYEQARSSAEKSIRLAQKVGIHNVLAGATGFLGLIAFEQGDYTTAHTCYKKSLALYKEIRDEAGIGFALYRLGDLAYTQGNNEQAQTYYEESLKIWQEIGHHFFVDWSLTSLGYLCLHQNHRQQAYTHFAESLSLHRKQGDKGGIATCVTGLAGIAEKQSQLELAARLLGTIEVVLEAPDIHLKMERFIRMIFDLPPKDKQTSDNPPQTRTAGQREYERIRDAVRSTLGEEAFAAAYAIGRTMTLDEAIAQALEGQ